MKSLTVFLALLAAAGCASQQESASGPASPHASECVIVLHGLIRTPRSMNQLEEALTEAGYLTVNDGYPSRDAEIAALADTAIEPAIANCRAQGATRINFVTHSLGGILVRYYLATNELPEIGRVVMLAPPNHGSEIVDSVRGAPGLTFFFGPAILQLGTDDASVPLQLNSHGFEAGIIAGQSTGILSGLLPGLDDGTVTVESTRLEGAVDFLIVDAGHTFMMSNDTVIEQTLFFLENGHFDRVATAGGD